MKELCEKDRPREKLLSKGASALGDSELLAVLIRCGTASCSALDLGNKMLSGNVKFFLSCIACYLYNFHSVKKRSWNC